MTILIPMAGLSSRFKKAGFTLPKYMLYIKDKSLFRLSVESFKKYFDSARFVFVSQKVFDTPRFIKNEAELMGIKDFSIIELESPTDGQAETVSIGIDRANVPDDESLLIFNIDTFRPGYHFPEHLKNSNGYLECFVGDGDNWSYAKTEDGNPETRVIETAEKLKISNFCSTGLYWFKNTGDYRYAYTKNGDKRYGTGKELYVAPLYNFLIAEGNDIRVNVIPRDAIIFCGVPSEYEALLKEIYNA